MGKLHELSYLPPDRDLAVAVCLDGVHLGLLYRNDPRNPDVARVVRLFHLFPGRKGKLLSRRPRPSDACSVGIVPDLDSPRITSMIGFIVLLWRMHRKNGFPYGFSDPRGFLDANGYVIDDTKSGLTCSTLVLAVFEHVGHTLLSYDHWCYGPEDQAERQRYIASYAAKNPKEPEQIYRLESEAASYRYAPLQVAGAAMSARPPASFDEAESNGKSIRRLLERRRFRRSP